MSGRHADGVLALRNLRVGSERAECRSAGLGGPAGPLLSTCVQIIFVLASWWPGSFRTVGALAAMRTLARSAMMRRL